MGRQETFGAVSGAGTAISYTYGLSCDTNAQAFLSGVKLFLSVPLYYTTTQSPFPESNSLPAGHTLSTSSNLFELL